MSNDNIPFHYYVAVDDCEEVLGTRDLEIARKYALLYHAQVLERIERGTYAVLYDYTGKER